MIDLKMPESVVSVTSKQAQNLLNLSRSTLGDYKWVLNRECPKGWDYQPMQRGFTRQQLVILAIFNHLVKTLGRRGAQQNLHTILEEEING